MAKTPPLKQLIDNNETLTKTNKYLVEVNIEAIEMTNKNIEKLKEILTHCGKIYHFLQSKNNKTWEEKESLDVLYHLITHTEKE